MTKLLVLLINFLCSPGTFNFRVSGGVNPGQLLLLKRSVDFLNKNFGCSLIGVAVDSQMKNVYDPSDAGNSFLFLQRVNDIPGVSSDAIAFSDDRFLCKSQGFGVHIAVDNQHSFPSTDLMFSADNKHWQSWDWDLVRVVIHEIGHSLGLHDDEEVAGPIMSGKEKETDLNPISPAEMKSFVSAVKSRGMRCQ